jgi:transcriptional regulator with XRE-family HTH domain
MSEKLTETLAKNLRKFMDEEEITTAMLAEWSGVSGKAIMEWLKGETLPREEKLMMVAKVFKRPLSDFYGNGRDRA